VLLVRKTYPGLRAVRQLRPRRGKTTNTPDA